MSVHIYSVDKCIAESHTDIECVNSSQSTKSVYINSVQGTAKVSGNPSPVE